MDRSDEGNCVGKTQMDKVKCICRKDLPAGYRDKFMMSQIEMTFTLNLDYGDND